MEKTFAGLLRHSRLASYDRTLPQVYTTPKKAKKTGNWGFKRGLPTVVRTRYVTVGDLDTAEHQTPWQSGESQVLFLKRWKENFPNSKAPSPRREQILHNVAAMNPQAFKKFLKQAIQQAPAFQQALKNKDVQPEEVYDYLSCHFNKDIMNEQQQQQDGGVVGPTYSDHQVEWNYPVKGRVLNQDSDGYAVGIAGVVAKLSRRNAIGFANRADRRVRDFYVLDAQVNQQGRPEINVNIQEHPSSMDAILKPIYYGLHNKNKNTAEPGLDDMLSGRSSSRFHEPQPNAEPDNTQPNPHHQDLMKRISGLLDNSTSQKK